MSSSEDPTRIHPTAPAPPSPAAVPPGEGAAPAGGERLTPHEPSVGGPGAPNDPPLPPTGGGGGGGGWDDGPGEPDHDERNRNWILAVIAGALVLIAVFLALNLTKDDEDDGRVDSTTPVEVAPTTPASTPAATPERAEPDPEPQEPDASTDDGGDNSSSGGGAPIDGADVQPADDGPLLESGGVTKLMATEGDTVRFQVKSEQDEEVHVHGYDLKYDVAAGETQTISFEASLTGIFEIEFEGSGEQIGELTVEP